MRMLAQSQNTAPRLNAYTLYGSNPVRLVSRAPSMVNPVPNHFSAVNVIIVLVYVLGCWLSTAELVERSDFVIPKIRASAGSGLDELPAW